MKRTLLIILVLPLSILLSQIYHQYEENHYPRKNLPFIYSEQQSNLINYELDSLMLDSIITNSQNSSLLPGIATLIIKDNDVIWNKNYGYRNLEMQLPVEDSTLFLVASISKTILITAAMQLWENGMIELENNINDYLPDGFTVANPSYPNDIITVKMLMNHTSTLISNWEIMSPIVTCGDSPISMEYFLLNYMSPGGEYYSSSNYNNFRPGQQRDYSNTGSCLLALIIENLTNQSFDEYSRDSIFTPLSMSSTSWFISGLDTSKIATPYWDILPLCHFGAPYYPIYQLRTNKLELSNFFLAYLNGGIFNGNSILNSSTISMMLSDQLGALTDWGGTQGLIWSTAPPPQSSYSWGHTGYWTGNESAMYLNQKEKWGYVIFYNTNIDNAQFWSTNSHLEIYANLYGNIYAANCSLDKQYAEIIKDTVVVKASFANALNHPFTPYLIYSNSENTLLDSVELGDNGLNGDSLANDGIYGAYIPPQHIEDFFSIGISTLDLQNNNYYKTSNRVRFTTSPSPKLELVDIEEYTLRDFRMKLRLSNVSSSCKVTNPWVRLVAADSSIIFFTPEVIPFPDIGKDSSVISTSYFYVDVSEDFDGNLDFNYEVLSDEISYWSTDSLRDIAVNIEKIPFSLPVVYELGQNHPNPFNPTTRINYSIPNQEFVSLKIFDVLGREVARLVNKEQPVGNYEVEFDATDLTSGIYFYRIQAGDFLETKKMVLMK